ncbi:MAG: YebC/PmpR family DNA-binding transcriptional regulator [Pseudomonadales bacterium]|nr:YebC/PmpR family DNA-binding transcriptional regulator [Pseudomonadales bacterium]
MAGHSKWANIKHRKARQDAVKGKVFTKFIREITVAARMGGPLEADNPRLRAIVAKALAANMSRDVVNRAIARGANSDDGKNLNEITYEGYGVNGVAVLVECMTDNLNRTVAEIRHAFSKTGGNLGTNGSVAYLFTQRGEIDIPRSVPEDKLMELALDAGADDVATEDEGYTVFCTPAQFGPIMDTLAQHKIPHDRAEVTMHASMQADIAELEQAEKILRMIDMLEDLDDVQNVYTNANFTQDVMEALNR